MQFNYPSQKLQDWLSQCWCISTGRRLSDEDADWLGGPFGNVDIIADRYVADLANSEGLEVVKNLPGFGILDPIDSLGLSVSEREKLHPKVVEFYENTNNYDLDVWTQWCPFYRPFALALVNLYTRRLQQLNLPQKPLDTSRGIRSQVYKLIDPENGLARYTIWYRHLKSTQEVIYSGIYGTCRRPDGTTCLKVIFPLPRGNATVIMLPTVTHGGGLLLTSKGVKFGDAGFYFLLENSKGENFVRYLPSLQETIEVFVDEEGVLRADHKLNLRGCKVLDLHYRMNPIQPKGS